MDKRFKKWEKPKVNNGELTVYNWLVQYVDGLKMGNFTDIGAFTYLNAKYGIEIEDYVQIGSHCSIYSVSTIDQKKGSVILKKTS